MLHSMRHWPDTANLVLWPKALMHAVFLWNHLPNRDSLISPIELLSGTKQPSFARLQRSHVWGSPVYVLDPKLHDGKKIPKWNPRSCRGKYMGQSFAHSSMIGRILNLKTGHISPQYHVVYDDLFTTVPNYQNGGLLDLPSFDANSWNQLVTTGLERHLDSIEYDPRGRQILPKLHDDWLLSVERRIRNDTRAQRRRRQAHAAQD
jgi:hypothetical protein